ncbi:MAG TPA: hypothetical protein VNO86_12355, partial [Candidatus Binatia bacterium]|nr:hypothetical protein [Candidatus Binatia bacterium]
DDVLSGGDDADVPPDRVDAGGGTSSSTSGSRSGGGGTVVTADDEAEFVEIRPGAMGYIWVENEDGSYTAYDPNTGAPVDGGTSGEEDEEEDEEEEEGTEGESGSEESMPVEGDAGPTTGAVRDRLGLIGGESDRVPVPGYVDPVDPEAGAASESGDLSVVRPGDPHINPDLISLYGPDGGADGSVTVSTSGTPPVLGSAPKDPPKPMPGGDDSVPGGSLTPGSNWGGGDPGGYDPTIAGGNDDDLDDLEIERLTGGGPSTPTQSATSQALGGAGSTIAVPIEGEDGTVDELTIQQLAGAGSSTPSQGLATEALGGYDPTVAGGNDDDLDDLEIERLTGGGPSTPTQSLASDALSGFDQALDAGDPALAGPTPFAPEATSPDIDAGPLPEPDEADALPG